MSSMALAPIPTGAGEIATTAAATQAMAAVQARYALAAARPRDYEQARAELLAECKRPGFAEVARYAKPIGGTSVEGPSVRFVEAALRAYKNIYREVSVLYDTASQRCVKVAVTDVESNLTHATEILISKTVERRRVREGQRVISERVNTQGAKVYLIEATEDELAVKQAAAISKAIRELGLRVLPGDLVDEGQALCVQTRMSRASEDPAAARKALLDAFVALGVQPVELAKYHGHPVGQLTPKEIAELRVVYTSIKSGEASWSELLAAHIGEDESESEDESKADKPKSDGKRAAKAAEKVRAAAASKEAQGGQE